MPLVGCVGVKQTPAAIDERACVKSLLGGRSLRGIAFESEFGLWFGHCSAIYVPSSAVVGFVICLVCGWPTEARLAGL